MWEEKVRFKRKLFGYEDISLKNTTILTIEPYTDD